MLHEACVDFFTCEFVQNFRRDRIGSDSRQTRDAQAATRECDRRIRRAAAGREREFVDGHFRTHHETGRDAVRRVVIMVLFQGFGSDKNILRRGTDGEHIKRTEHVDSLSRSPKSPCPRAISLPMEERRAGCAGECREESAFLSAKKAFILAKAFWLTLNSFKVSQYYRYVFLR